MEKGRVAVVTIWTPLEIVINRLIGLDPDASRRLAPLVGKVIGVEFRNLPLRWFLRVSDRALHFIDEPEHGVDTRLRGTPLALVAMGLRRGGTRGLFSGDVEVEGDLEVGRAFKRFLDELDIDWEEQLATFVGDTLAHQMGNTLRNASSWGRNVVQTLSIDAAEYFQEESRDLPLPSDVREFLDQVDQVRIDVDRLAARIDRLHHVLARR